jgi:hypothetical protein
MNMAINETSVEIKTSAASSVGIVVATGLHYVQVNDRGVKHELIGPFRTREQAQAEVAKWVDRFRAELEPQSC